jgi:hypothetical protein
MRKLLVTAVAAAALAVAGTAAAALVPSVFDPGSTGCPVSTFSNGVLHLAKNCTSDTNAAALAEITGVSGSQFQSAEFTLANASQCQGGSPRFNVYTTTGGDTPFFLGCNNVTPTTNGDGTATYVFTPQTIAAAGNQVGVPTGTITRVMIVLDIQGSADLTNIKFNGTTEVPVTPTPTSKDACKHGGYKAFGFKNQGRCVSFFEHQLHAAKHHR